MSNSSESRSLGPAAGWRWFKTAVVATREQPFALMGITLFYMFSMGFLSIMPIVGAILSALFMPFGTVFIGRATRDAIDQKAPSFGILGSLWRCAFARKHLIYLGLAFGFVLITVNVVYSLLSADEMARWALTENDRLDWKTVRENLPYDAILVALAIYIPGLMATWFAPLLISEKNMTCVKAMFYSFFGCLRNLLPIFVLGGLLIGTTLGSTLGMLFIIDSFELASIEMYLLTPIAFLLTTIAYATYWPMYVALFGDVNKD